ncbi:sensory neuron membrane protein 1 [Cephus cinctus]|uniref:Sensory neuron membrane protein 1 n=1 Tax=Cephus cinctus TaxID=211228 RepID=A0AAJ7FDZ3_CEPCN|nr:sensory neuron membrane protein 1 [Cephus cinctus]XP_015587039.1 sensory neuron membrane protein 1 [Cephus cinctus]XP_015587040.1 sensory neuron membrane protein 1 [Cephus cinctus]
MQLSTKLGIGGGALFVMSIVVGWIAFPIMLKSQVKGAIALKEGSDMRALWAKFPLPLDFKVYLFNITNPAGIESGEKPIVREIGPYFYDEYKEKLNLEDRESDDTVEYSQRATWFFNPSKSNGLTGDEELVYPHVLILGMAMTAARDKPGMMGLLGKAVDSIFKKPDSIFIKVKARDILFDGLPIDCTVKDFAGTAVCKLLKEQGNDLQVDGDNRYRFSLFGHKNGTVARERMRVFRGIKSAMDVGRVVEWNNEPALTVWPEDRCNEYNGTDSTIFHPFFKKEDDVVSFAPDLCRSIGARYERPSHYKGLSTNRYTANLGDMSTDPHLQCFCPTPETCLKKGLFDLTKCVNAPIIASLPHFYLTDESYLETVQGLQPVQEDHEIFIDFEPLTGSPVSARKRLQFNMFVYPVEKFRLMKTFASALLPLFWVEEGIALNDDFVKQLKAAFKMISLVGYIKWSMMSLGLGLAGAAGGLYFKRRQTDNKLTINTITPQMASTKNSGEEKKWPLNINTLQAATVPASLDRN